MTRTEVLAARDALFAELQQFRRDADADLAASLQQELTGATDRYQQLKNAAGALDFADLLVARARSDQNQRRGAAAPAGRNSRGSSSTSSRTRIRSRPRSCCCSRPMTLRRSNGVKPVRLQASCSSSAIPSRRSTDSAAPMSATYWQVSQQVEARGGQRAAADERATEACRRFSDSSTRRFGAQMSGDERALQADYVPLSPRRA